MTKVNSVITKHFIDSAYLEKIFKFQILQEKNARSGREMDILIVHDGDDYLELGKLQQQFENDLQNGLENNVSFILLPPGSSEDRWHYYDSKGEQARSYLYFIYEELLPKLEEMFTIGRLGMLGDSLAGAVSFRIGLHDPGRWSHILLQSAAFSKDDVRFGEKLQHSLPWNLYQSVGTEEDHFISPITNEQLYILTRNRMIKESIQAKNHTYIENGHGHLWECWRGSLSAAIKIFYLT
ncbi:alpha/beta hydrolase-fold protein [Guptibacillus hwajinpoensis]|uniref:alpha/beta hydrolase-fold protein n=1 Tax=Guptibacillus hwajinpoensis TaxID=208199 RepID=UPI00384DF1B2